MSEAQKTIGLWQTELQLGIISEEDKASLVGWLTYLKQLQAVDTNLAPNLNLPIPPQKN
nr:tail fiber assembly protein [Citrobacter sp. R56]